MSTTSTQLDLLFLGKPSPIRKPLTGPELAQSGIEQAYMNAPDELEWKYIVAITRFNVWSKLTSEDLRKYCGDPPFEYRNCLAGVLKFACSMKLIRITGRKQKAERASIHGKDLSVYLRLDTKIEESKLKQIFIDRKARARAAEARKKLAIKGERVSSMR